MLSHETLSFNELCHFMKNNIPAEELSLERTWRKQEQRKHFGRLLQPYIESTEAGTREAGIIHHSLFSSPVALVSPVL